jgi:hypothetical protein
LVLDQDSVSAVSFRIVGSLDKQVFLNLGGVLS